MLLRVFFFFLKPENQISIKDLKFFDFEYRFCFKFWKSILIISEFFFTCFQTLKVSISVTGFSDFLKVIRNRFRNRFYVLQTTIIFTGLILSLCNFRFFTISFAILFAVVDYVKQFLR